GARNVDRSRGALGGTRRQGMRHPSPPDGRDRDMGRYRSGGGVRHHDRSDGDVGGGVPQAPMSAGEPEEREMADVEELQARVAALEQENAQLRTGRKGFAWRSLVAGLLIVVGLILAPIAVLGTWARVQLVDTERFVSTFAPLAQDPDVQAFISDQVS